MKTIIFPEVISCPCSIGAHLYWPICQKIRIYTMLVQMLHTFKLETYPEWEGIKGQTHQCTIYNHKRSVLYLGSPINLLYTFFFVPTSLWQDTYTYLPCFSLSSAHVLFSYIPKSCWSSIFYPVAFCYVDLHQQAYFFCLPLCRF